MTIFIIYKWNVKTYIFKLIHPVYSFVFLVKLSSRTIIVGVANQFECNYGITYFLYENWGRNDVSCLISCSHLTDDPICVFRNSDINLRYWCLTILTAKRHNTKKIPRFYSVKTLSFVWIIDEQSTSRISSTSRFT